MSSPSVVCRMYVTLLHPRQRLELFGYICAPPNSSETRTGFVLKFWAKIRRSSRGSCKINTRGYKNWRVSTNIWPYFENGTIYGHSYNGRRIAIRMRSMLSNGTISNDLQWLQSYISRSRYSERQIHNSKTVQDLQRQTNIKSYMNINRHHIQWPSTTLNGDLKVTPIFDAEYLSNGRRYIFTDNDRQQELVCDLSNGAISSDLEWPPDLRFKVTIFWTSNQGCLWRHNSTELNWPSWTAYSQVSRVFVYDVMTYKLNQLGHYVHW